MKTIQTKTTKGTEVTVTINLATVTINMPLADGTRVDIRSRYGKIEERGGKEMWYGYHNDLTKCTFCLPDDVTAEIMQELEAPKVEFDPVKGIDGVRIKTREELVESRKSFAAMFGFSGELDYTVTDEQYEEHVSYTTKVLKDIAIMRCPEAKAFAASKSEEEQYWKRADYYYGAQGGYEF